MSAPFKFWGFDVVEESGPSSRSVGVVVSGVRMLANVYAVGQRLAEAGADGISVRDANRSHIEMLGYAGHVIERDAMGLRYIMKGELRAPEKYITKVQPKAEVRTASPITGGDWIGRGD